MRYVIHGAAESRSFPEGDAFLSGQSSAADADVIIFSSGEVASEPGRAAVLVELDHEFLAEHIDDDDPDFSNVLGFARFRNGNDAPSPLVELVRRAHTTEAAIAAARSVFEAAGLQVVVCSDQAGRIINRLAVPKYNAALRFLDEGLASQADMDLTCKLGLGYRDGPIERVARGGLDQHYLLSRALFDAYGTPAYAPARRAAVAFRRRAQGAQ